VSSPDKLVDTSAAVALVVVGHEGHERTMEALDGFRLGLAGHAWFETFSVLTRLPPPARRGPDEVVAILNHNFHDSRFLSEQGTFELTEVLAELGLAGGAIYDALVGKAAAMHGLPLVTRDRRAVPVYQALGVQFELLK
jgi:predicted nucleic acid-binding protein